MIVSVEVVACLIALAGAAKLAAVDEHAVAAVADEKRNRLVHQTAFNATGVIGPEHEFLAPLVE